MKKYIFSLKKNIHFIVNKIYIEQNKDYFLKWECQTFAQKAKHQLSTWTMGT